MKRSLMIIAILAGVPIASIGLLLIAYFGEFPLPVSSGAFERDWKFRSLVTQGDQIIGGGYSFAEARDIWIRIRLNQEPEINRVALQACSPKALKTIQTWFLEQAAAPDKIFGILPISNVSQADAAALSDVENLRCYSTEDFSPITHRFGESPSGCTDSWILYHAPSQFYYERSSCIH